MPMNTKAIIPLFPLGLVLFPGMPLPLHIFEERYKLMISECLDQNKEFGVVLFNGHQIQDIGCSAIIIRVLKEYSDGKSDILCIGKKRFFIKKLLESEAYLESEVIFFDDEIEQISPEWEDIAARGINILLQTESIPPKEEGLHLLKKLDYKGISFLIAGSDGFTPEEKQVFLEMTSTLERLRKGIRSLEKIMERNLISQEIQQIIGGNGNVRKYFHVS
jgi:Lon protease-like protein